MKTAEAPDSAWLSGLECHPVAQKAADLIPSQSTYPDCRFDPHWGVYEQATDQGFSFPCLSPSPSLSLPPLLPVSLKAMKKKMSLSEYF